MATRGATRARGAAIAALLALCFATTTVGATNDRRRLYQTGCRSSCNNCCGTGPDASYYNSGSSVCWRVWLRKYSCSSCANTGNCAAGKYKTGSCGGSDNTLTCKNCDNANCPAGEYQTGSCSGRSNDFQCKACSNKQCSAGQKRSGSCSGRNNDYACSNCAAGKFQSEANYEGSDCSGCGVGKISGSGAADCTLCAAGKIANAAKDACVACAAGEYATDGAQCEKCAIGKVSTSPVSGSCESCATGQTTNMGNAKGGSVCEDCAPGKFLNNHVCQACTAGYYQATKNKENCNACSSGKISANNAATGCTVCNSGKHAPTEHLSSCVNCDAGFFTPAGSEAYSSCDDCEGGKYSPAAASSCSVCQSGKAQASAGQSQCDDCTPGKYNDANPADPLPTACKLCDNGDKDYTDDHAATSCKQCSADSVPTTNRGGCTTCNNDKGPASYLDTETTTCKYCVGCLAGTQKTECSMTSSCAPCAVGRFKDSDQTAIANEVIKGIGWDTSCQMCAACPAGKIRGAGDPCFGSGASSQGGCQSCAAGRFKLASVNYMDVCSECQTCHIGKSRDGCGDDSAGSCVAWERPTVTGLSGPGLSGFTSGATVLNIEGKYFGPVRSGPDAVDIIVTYGPYTAVDCQVIAADPGLKKLNDAFPGNTGRIRCLTAEGVGSNHSLRVTIGKSLVDDYAGLTSDLFAEVTIGYHPPIVATYSGPGSEDASTYGGELLVVTGANFGPTGSAHIDSAIYGDGEGYAVSARNCTVTVDHVEMRCQTGPGGGVGNKLIVTIGGQASSIPSINYGAPYLRTKYCTATPDKHGMEVAGEVRCDCARCKGVSTSDATGETRTMVPAITVGATPCSWRLTDQNPCNVGSLAPTVGDVNRVSTLSTKGYQMVVLNGGNFGSTAELEGVSFGPSTGRQVAMKLYASPNSIPKSSAGCAVLVPSFSIACSTTPGIAGPHMFVVTVRGQSSQPVAVGSISYATPVLKSIASRDAPNGELSTSGTQVVEITGTEFGSQDDQATYRVVLTKGPSSSRPVSQCADWKGDAKSCYEIPALKATETGAGMERVTFNSPTSFGRKWNVRLIVSNSYTGQSTFVDSSDASTNADGAPIWLNFANPVIASVEIEARDGTSGRYLLKVSGSNFCDGNTSGCGNIFICTANCSNSTSGPWKDDPHRDSFVSQTSRVLSWSHTEIVAEISEPAGNVYVEVGLTNDIIVNGDYQRTVGPPWSGFNTEKPTLISGGADFASSSMEYSGNAFPTAGGDNTNVLEIYVRNLPNSDPNAPVTIKVNANEAPVVSYAVLNAAEKIWKVQFRVPKGSGVRQEISIWRNMIDTQNRAYISYQKPTITGVNNGSDAGPSVAVAPGAHGVIPTAGAPVILTGTNLGDFSSNMQGFALSFISTSSNVEVQLSCSVVTAHTKMRCIIPPGTGIGYQMRLVVGDQSPRAGLGYWPQSLGGGQSIGYSPPVVSKIIPSGGSTEGGQMITVKGRDFGTGLPSVFIGGKRCIVTVKPAPAIYHSEFACKVPAGTGKNLPVVVTAGVQSSTPVAGTDNVFSYDAPVVSNVFPTSGLTSGLTDTGERQQVMLTGQNFGQGNVSDFYVEFMTVGIGGQENAARFRVSASDIISHTHTKLVFFQPEGYGATCGVAVHVTGQDSADVASVRFAYGQPEISSIAPYCGAGTMCWGYNLPQYLNVESYPKILDITVDIQGTATVRMTQGDLPDGASYQRFEVGDKIVLTGVSERVGVNTGSSADFTGDWTVTKVVSNDGLIWEFHAGERGADQASISADLYQGWNSPAGNLRALAAKTYQLASAASFQTLETDGCSATYTSANGTPLRSNGWEPFKQWKDRVSNENQVSSRQCVTWGNPPTKDAWNYQEIIITGKNFGAENVPVTVTMTQKECDCKLSLGGEATPCMHPTTKLCSVMSGGECPKGYVDCASSDTYLDPRELDIVKEGGHSHNRIVIRPGAGRGRRHRIDVTIGKARKAVTLSTVDDEERFLRYKPPTVEGFEKSGDGVVFSPDGKTKLIINGYNFGYKNRSTGVEPDVEIRIGVEFNVAGAYCGDSKNCMKICQNSTWHEFATAGMANEGFPYLSCVIPLDTAGFKNISVRIDGQVDDCRSNRRLCGYPIGFPFDRRTTTIGSNDDLSNLLRGDGVEGAIFTCATSSQASQSYAKPGELCQSEANGLCADEQCLSPKANPGFWRLDLDLEWACNAGTSISGTDIAPCQKEYAPIFEEMSSKATFAQSIVSSLNPFDEAAGVSGAELCSAGIQESGNLTQCATDLRLCSTRGANPAGTCVFRRPEEARRALGAAFWPWACPTETLADLSEASKDKCRSANPDAFAYVTALTQPSCPVSRTNHLVNATVYEEFPGLEQSSTCYGVVACNPKESCLGDNECALGYEYNKHRCKAYNADNPDRVNCTSDDQCRSRSGSVTSSNGASSGLSSACAYDKPEDCSRCVFSDPTSSVGQCECMGGGPRCGLCRQAGGGIDPITGESWKGYYRLNDECQECPDNPGLLIALMACGIIAFCVVGWWLQDKKVNVAFLSIGVDYFQVLAIFARIKVRWPLWVKQILQILSIFNFNIDITAPECLVPEFDYKTKWILMMSAPLAFAGVLLLIAVSVCLKKFIAFRCCGGSRPKYHSHMSKLISMFIIIFYFLYLTITRRALDIFNCNPAEPDDGYLYTEFTSIECPGGTCVCDDPAGLQTQLKPFAVVGFIIYSLGFPLFVFWITWYYRVQIKLDQLLRAHSMGDERFQSDVYIDTRACRSRERKTYDIRKKYKDIYYHFKPGKVYWMLVVLTRKLLVALFALLFRRNVAFLLSCILLVLFASYVLQVRNKPYMSQVERADVIVAHRAKVVDAELAVQDQMRRVDGPVISEQEAKMKIKSDLRMHLDIAAGIRRLKEEMRRKFNQRRNSVSHTRMSDALAKFRNKKSNKERIYDYYFDYNTVEQVLIMCSIFLSLVAIMFESGQFYVLDPDTGAMALSTDPTNVTFYTVVLVMGAISLIGSLVYYATVLMSEMLGCVPQWLRVLCAHKLSATNKRNLTDHDDARNSFDDGVFEMAPIESTVFANPLQDLEEAKKKHEEVELKNQRLLKMHEEDMQQRAEIIDAMRKVKQDAAKSKPKLKIKKSKRGQKKREFAQHVAIAEKE